MNDTTSRTGTSTQASSPKVSVLSEGLCKFLDALVEEMVREDLARLTESENKWMSETQDQ